ncbi:MULTISPECIES: hypothetical protein [Moraxella]|uniref:hypothetical protein n=1 Tax=Moraxella TaxID=475 RepID=UPI0018CC1B2F|nr:MULTISPECIES: hypothetical protein [Moraxella]MDH9218902.1 hypothetical protein [Moraxella lacunata]
MDDIKQKANELAQYLYKKQILNQELPKIMGNDLMLFFVQIKQQLNLAFPNTKSTPKMKSIHYANGFQDEKLKNIAFILDDIEEILSQNHHINHDKVVSFFNQTITESNFEVSPKNLVIVHINSLLNC